MLLAPCFPCGGNIVQGAHLGAEAVGVDQQRWEGGQVRGEHARAPPHRLQHVGKPVGTRRRQHRRAQPLHTRNADIQLRCKQLDILVPGPPTGVAAPAREIIWLWECTSRLCALAQPPSILQSGDEQQPTTSTCKQGCYCCCTGLTAAVLSPKIRSPTRPARAAGSTASTSCGVRPDSECTRMAARPRVSAESLSPASCTRPPASRRASIQACTQSASEPSGMRQVAR